MLRQDTQTVKWKQIFRMTVVKTKATTDTGRTIFTLAVVEWLRNQLRII